MEGTRRVGQPPRSIDDWAIGHVPRGRTPDMGGRWNRCSIAVFRNVARLWCEECGNVEIGGYTQWPLSRRGAACLEAGTLAGEFLRTVLRQGSECSRLAGE